MTPKERADAFVSKLLATQADRGKMAQLRRGLTDSGKPQAWMALASLGGIIDSPAYLATGGLFAMHPTNTEAGSIGFTCHCITKQRRVKPEQFAPRFNRLVSCATDEELAQHLTSLVTMAKSCGVPINYRQMFCDLWNWRWYRDEISVRWAKEYWSHTRN